MSDTIVRVYADFDGLVAGVRDPRRAAVVLDTHGAMRDLANAGMRLIEGLPLIATAASGTGADFEGRGTAQYDRSKQRWLLEFDASGVRHVSARPREQHGAFVCDRCEARVPVRRETAIVMPRDRCPECGVTLIEFFAAPA